jgi:DNA-binding SARP family transcriptional activator
VLLTSPNVAISDDRLIDALWGDDPPATAHHRLQVYASQLRRAPRRAAGRAAACIWTQRVAE